MICLRCGYCCISYDVIVIKVDCIDQKSDDWNEDSCFFKESGVMCPHLRFNGDKAICNVHSKSWFKLTPCYAYGQIEGSKLSECRVGMAVRDKKIDDCTTRCIKNATKKFKER